MLVIGSTNSSNSNRLVEVARDHGADSHLIDNASQVREEWLDGVETLGITSGASAPEELVSELVEFFRARGTDDVSELRTVDEDVRFMLPKKIRVEAGRAGLAPAPAHQQLAAERGQRLAQLGEVVLVAEQADDRAARARVVGGRAEPLRGLDQLDVARVEVVDPPAQLEVPLHEDTEAGAVADGERLQGEPGEVGDLASSSRRPRGRRRRSARATSRWTAPESVGASASQATKSGGSRSESSGLEAPAVEVGGVEVHEHEAAERLDHAVLQAGR